MTYIPPDKQKPVQVKKEFSFSVVHWNSLAVINLRISKSEQLENDIFILNAGKVQLYHIESVITENGTSMSSKNFLLPLSSVPCSFNPACPTSMRRGKFLPLVNIIHKWVLRQRTCTLPETWTVYQTATQLEPALEKRLLQASWFSFGLLQASVFLVNVSYWSVFH